VPIRLEANRVQNEGMGRKGYENRKKKYGMSSHEQRLIIELMLDYR